MKKIERRRLYFVGILALILSVMQVEGWQRSMKYGTSMHTSRFFQNIGVLEGWQCLLIGAITWMLLSVVLYVAFGYLSKKKEGDRKKDTIIFKYIWPISAGILMLVYFIYLVGCYPGYYNYDGETQMIQVMYKEVPYETHHPLLHTLFIGGIMTFGYNIHNVDLTFAVFLYCLIQMAICAVCFGYSIRFIYQYSCKRVMAILALVFYAVCPPVVMFAMSTTKDTICYAILLVAVIKLFNIYRAEEADRSVSKFDWILTSVSLTFSCLLRNNMIYAVLVVTALSVFYCWRKNRKGLFVLFVSVLLMEMLINTSLMKALKAEPGAVTEAMSVPFQQIARLYYEEGEGAFEEDELSLLYATIEPEMLGNYNPMISDPIKYAFWRHLDVISERKGECLSLWVRKGLQYPKIYVDSFLDNTYQAWYPATLLMDKKGPRYFDITEWQAKYGTPKIQRLYDYYKGVYLESSYAKYPVIRMFFSIGAMLWILLITWVYSLWKKDAPISWTLLLIVLICATFLLGPVSDVRYYLILFYLFPVCIGFLFTPRTEEVPYSTSELVP